MEEVTRKDDDDDTVTSSPKAADDQPITPPRNKLCGYLNKINTRGPLKSIKRRWFVYSENNCKLYCYRTPHDSDHLAEIDIAKATFSFEVTNLEKPGLFCISTPTKVYELEAKDREACLFWLQELQLRRKEFSRKCTAKILNNGKLNRIHSVGKLESGLLCRQMSIQSSSIVDDVAISSLLIPVERPKGDVGEEAAEQFDRMNSRTWSFSTIKERVKRARHANDGSTAMSQVATTDVSLSDNVSSSTANVSSKEENEPLSPKKNSFRWRLASFRGSKDRSSSIDAANTCKKCEQCVEELAVRNDQLTAVKDELEASREVIKVLQAQVDCLSRQRDTFLQSTSMKTKDSDLLSKKDAEIAELVDLVREKEQQNFSLSRELQCIKSELLNLKEQLGLYETAIQVKDQVLVNFADQMCELDDNEENDQVNSINSKLPANPSFPLMSLQDSTDVEKLRDALTAFQLQNKFLNKEILELNHLRKESEDRQDRLLVRCSEWEAKYYQIQSKYLLLLNELHTPKKDDGTSQEVLSQLFEDALFLQVQPNYAKAKCVILKDSNYDEFGFLRIKESDEPLISKASDLQKRSEELSNYLKDSEKELWQNRWENFILSLGNKDLTRDLAEIKPLIRSGIPHEHKGIIWKRCVEMWIKPIKEKQKPGYYQKLLDSHRTTTILDAAAKQIELDLLRTLPNNKHYETLHSDGIPHLRRVLLAYSWHNSEVGYCQGLNRIAAIALLFMNEEDTFWCLIAIIECIMPSDYYSKTLIASQVDQRVLKELLADKLPRLYAHFEHLSVDLSLFTFNWFLCIFVDTMPFEVYSRVWDVFLFEGTKVLFRYSLAFLKIHEEEILQVHDAMSMNHFIRTAAERFYDVKRLTQVAFNDLNPFRMRVIKSKRNHHLQVVKAELEELERIREEFRLRSEPRFDYVDSEEEGDAGDAIKL